MKQIATFLFVALFFTTATFAQSKWKLNAVNIQLGVNWNEFESMSLDELMIFAKDPEQMHRDLSFMTEEATTITAGGDIKANFSWSPLNRATGTYRTHQELQVGIALHSPKEAMVAYKSETLDTSIVYCNLHSELSLEGAYVWRGQWGKRKRWHWYVGGGMNAGFTWDNEMVLMEGKYFEPGQHPSTQPIDDVAPEPERYEAKSVVYSRIFIPYGLHYQIGKYTTLGLDFRTGRGLQFIGSEKVNWMRRSGGMALGMRFILF
ncbi:MAG: hypothetical protein AAF573_14275 [Bacteroidota bacterium]